MNSFITQQQEILSDCYQRSPFLTSSNRLFSLGHHPWLLSHPTLSLHDFCLNVLKLNGNKLRLITGQYISSNQTNLSLARRRSSGTILYISSMTLCGPDFSRQQAGTLPFRLMPQVDFLDIIVHVKKKNKHNEI